MSEADGLCFVCLTSLPFFQLPFDSADAGPWGLAAPLHTPRPGLSIDDRSGADKWYCSPM